MPEEIPVACRSRLTLSALPGLPIVRPGDDLAALLRDALARAEIALEDGDVLVVASKLVSRAEGRFVDLTTVIASPRAREIAHVTHQDPRLVELVLGESSDVSRAEPDAFITRHRLGFVCANAGIDFSNALPEGAAPGSGPWAVLLPIAPDASALRLRTALASAAHAEIGVIIAD